MFIGPCIVVIVEELKTNLMSLVIFISLLIFSTCFERKEVCTVQSQTHIQSTSKKALNTKSSKKNTTHKWTQWKQKHNI